MIFKNILQLYALIICAISVIILMIVAGVSLISSTNLLIPEYSNYPSMGHYESNEAYIRFREERYYPGGEEDKKKDILALKQLSPQALTEQRINAKKDFLETERRSSIQTLIFCLMWTIVALFFFYIHWRLYKKATKNS